MKGIKVGDVVERYCTYCDKLHKFTCMRFDQTGTPQGVSTHRCPELGGEIAHQCLDVDYPPSGKRIFVGPDLYVFEPNAALIGR